MKAGGNGEAKKFFEQYGWTDFTSKKTSEKYNSRAATMYKAYLDKKVENERNQLLPLISEEVEVSTPLEGSMIIIIIINIMK